MTTTVYYENGHGGVEEYNPDDYHAEKGALVTLIWKKNDGRVMTVDVPTSRVVRIVNQAATEGDR